MLRGALGGVELLGGSREIGSGIIPGIAWGRSDGTGLGRALLGASGGDGDHIYKSVNFGTDPVRFGKDWHLRGGRRGAVGA